MIDKEILEEAPTTDHPKIYGFTKEELDKSFRAYKTAVEKDQKYFKKYFGNKKGNDAELLYLGFKDIFKKLFKT